MTYYSIHFTMSQKLRGSNDYIKKYNLFIPDSRKLYFEEPNFIGNVNHEKINFTPYLLNIELLKNSIINDLIIDGGPVSGKPIISEKLKSIIEKYRTTGMQFFNINIIQERKEYNNYWLLNMYEFNDELIDFKNSTIYYEKHSADFKTTYNSEKLLLKVNTFSEFIKYYEETKITMESIYIQKLALKKDITEEFFALKYVMGSMYYVSEKLKQEIEEAGCTGIEFQPVEFSTIEWLQGGEREKVYGKS